MKKIKTIVCLLLVVTMLSGVLVVAAACGEGFKEDPTKTNIRVTTYNGGLGKAWLEKAAKAFEEKYANKSFEEGKTGVKVHVDYCQGGNMMIDQTLSKDVYFTEVVDYFQYVNKGKVADITDVVTGDLAEFGESGVTIESKLDNSYKTFLTAGSGSANGKYYALPFYEGYMGFIYDRDLFVEKELFFSQSGSFTGDLNRLSVGADGVKGTYDDGLPVTYSDFQKLVTEMKNKDVVPFIFGEDALPYFQKLLAGFWADYEGKENMLKNWDFTGSFNIVTGWNGDTPTIGTYTFDQSNIASSVKELQKQPGKYYALKFLKDTMLSDTNNYDSKLYKSAQSALIASKFGNKFTQYGMLIDGVWWENEANLAGSFANLWSSDLDRDDASTKDNYKQYRNFAFMPFPVEDAKYEAEKAAGIQHKQTLYSANDAFCFISSETKGAKLEVSKLFLQYVHTDEQMSSFTATTSIPRALNYTLLESDKESMSYFGKNVMEIKAASDIVYPYSGHSYYVSNSATFVLSEWGWKFGNNDNPYTGLQSTSAKDYFNGLYTSR